MPNAIEKGTVSKSRDKFFVNVGKRKLAIPAAFAGTTAELSKLAGKEVEVVFSSKGRRAIIAIRPVRPRPAPCYWIICYIPAPDILKRVDPRIRREIVQAFVEEKVITPELGKEITSGLG